jgi:hypothetical protein
MFKKTTKVLRRVKSEHQRIIELQDLLKLTSFDVNNLNKHLGHCGESYLISTAKNYDLEMIGKLEA